MSNYKILCLGDSLTHGYTIDTGCRWTDLLQNKLGVEVVNCGINGDTTNGMLTCCQSLIQEHKPTHIVILGGTNDLWFGLSNELIISNIHAIVRHAKYYNVIPIVGIITTILNKKERNLIKENYVERITKFQDLLSAYCLVDNQITISFSENMKDEHFLEDGLHPNKAGQVIMKDNALKVLKSIL